MAVLDMFSLKNKVALLTGGAGAYGRQIVAALAEAGATVYMASRNLKALRQVADDYCRQGMDVNALAFDLGKEQSILELVEEITARTGRIDILVNNAVARVANYDWEMLSAAEFDQSMHINATGLFLVTRAVGKVMAKQQDGSIINIASMMGMVGVEPGNYRGTDMYPFSAPDYFFHKGGMINFTRYCASYFGAQNIRVNSISPGGLQTENTSERFANQYSERTQLGRMADDTDLKGCIVFLASDASRYITGTNIPVDGGYTAK